MRVNVAEKLPVVFNVVVAVATGVPVVVATVERKMLIVELSANPKPLTLMLIPAVAEAGETTIEGVIVKVPISPALPTPPVLRKTLY